LATVIQLLRSNTSSFNPLHFIIRKAPSTPSSRAEIRKTSILFLKKIKLSLLS